MNTAITIGVAGHVDHGKTTLVKALTGIDTDRKAEEKARGLSIESGVAELRMADGHSVALIDVPGHTDFLKNTIRGLNSVDLAMLVVAADDGVMPQTREHLEILKFFDVRAGMVVLTKTDLVDPETLELARMEVDDLLAGTFLEQRPLFMFNNKQPELGKAIVSGIQAAIASVAGKQTDRPFRMWIDQVKSIAGHGTVVSGTVSSGRIRCNDTVALLPAGIQTRARSLQTHACSVSHAVAGQRVGINLHRVPLDKVQRGMSLGIADEILPILMLNADIHVLADTARGIKNRQRVKVYIGTSVTSAMIVLMDGDVLAPGRNGLVQIRLKHPVPVMARDTLVISPLNLRTVIAGGRVLEVTRQKYRSAKSMTVRPVLSMLQKGDVDAYIENNLVQQKGRLVTAKSLAAKTGLPPSVFERTINSRVQKGEWIYFKGQGAIAANRLQALQKEFGDVVDQVFARDPMKKKVGLAEIAEVLEDRIDDVLLRHVADALLRENKLIRLDGGYRPVSLPERPSDGRPQEDTIAAFVMDYIERSGLTPVSPGYFSKRHPSKLNKAKAVRLFDYLHQQKRLVRLNDNRYLSCAAMDEIKQRVARAIQAKGHITLFDCKEVLGYGRSGGAHVLDYLNAIGFTVRREDKHYLQKDGG